jgi:hypothetical protein
VKTDAGHLDAIGATSASLVHESDERMAGFNVYDVDDAGGVGVTSHRVVMDAGGKSVAGFREVSVPRH